MKTTLQKLAELKANWIAGKMSAVTHGRLREELLAQGLADLARSCGKEAPRPCISSHGEYLFCVNGPEPVGYGGELARLLNTILVRTGAVAGKGHILPENSWCHIHHFEVEKLLETLPR